MAAAVVEDVKTENLTAPETVRFKISDPPLHITGLVFINIYSDHFHKISRGIVKKTRPTD